MENESANLSLLKEKFNELEKKIDFLETSLENKIKENKQLTELLEKYIKDTTTLINANAEHQRYMMEYLEQKKGQEKNN